MNLLLISGVLLISTLPAAAQVTPSVDAPSWDLPADASADAPDLLVQLADWSDFEQVCEHVRRLEGSVRGGIPGLGILRVTPDAARGAAVDQRDAYRRDASVLGVEVNRRVEAAGRAAVPGGRAAPGAPVPAPDDTYFSKQWPLVNTVTPGADIQILQAWAIQRGSPEIVVAVLDSGLTDGHVEFQGRLVPGYDYIDEDAVPQASPPHGMYVAFILGANAGNAFGIAGVNPRCRILPLRVISTFGGTIFDLAQGIDHAMRSRVSVMSMSVVHPQTSVILEDALATAEAAGIVLVAAAGNGSAPFKADNTWPGASPHTISVGYTTIFDTLSSDSGKGLAVDVVAPGAGVPVPVVSGVDILLPGDFVGSSAAAPIVSGIASLLLAEHPGLSPQQVRELLIAGALDEIAPDDPPGKDNGYGHGRVNAFRSLQALCGCDGSEPLRSSPQVVRPALGEWQLLRIDAGPEHAGGAYRIVGTVSGTSPGTMLGGLPVPLNPDRYTIETWLHPESWLVSDFAGVLDARGRATAELHPPPAWADLLAGVPVQHAALVFDGGEPVFVSNAVELAVE